MIEYVNPNETVSPTEAASPADGVSFVMPVLNERHYLAQAVESVLRQDVDGPFEVILALGPSTDGTNELAQEMARRDSRIRLADNPDADIPVGLNAAIQRSRFPIIVRVDAHSELSNGYTRRAIATLQDTGAANVGGVMRAQGKTPFQRAVAFVYNSPIGLGGSAYHSGTKAREADSAYLGVMRRSAIEQVGLFDESIRRGEDWELNLRLRRAGFKVWFDPSLAVTYWPRESWWRLARQFNATGAWRGELVRRYGRGNSLRYFAPVALVFAILGAIVTTLIWLLTGRNEIAGIVALICGIPVVAHAILDISVAFLPGRRSLKERLWGLVVLPTMHISWGWGFLGGVLTGARRTVDTSRIGSRNTPLP